MSLIENLEKIEIMWSKFRAVDFNSEKIVHVNFTRMQRIITHVGKKLNNTWL